ncbi:hypothetical protein HYC85_000185 [Camellia sinensis]|uniref:Uncharacterized protein n=1 Tax=Camellia sinensis TaxID=4442 RepID=A0A7J7I3E6_CAMSI|nr:hypothetical protein HYC85_000185 [Camellia sinensis]
MKLRLLKDQSTVLEESFKEHKLHRLFKVISKIQIDINRLFRAISKAACALLNLSLIDVNKISIGACREIPPLITLLMNGSNRGKKDAMTTLYKLCTVKVNKERAVKGGAVKAVVGLVAAEQMAEKAMVVMSSLAAVAEGKEAIVEEGGIAALVEVIEDGSPKGKEFAAHKDATLVVANLHRMIIGSGYARFRIYLFSLLHKHLHFLVPKCKISPIRFWSKLFTEEALESSLQDVVSRYSFMDLWPCSSKDLDHLARQEWLSKNVNKKNEKSALANGAVFVDRGSSGLTTNSNQSTKVVYPDTSRMVIYDPRQKAGPSAPRLPTVSRTLTASSVVLTGGGTPNAPNEFLKATLPALLAFIANLPTVEGLALDIDFVLSICLQSNIPTGQTGKSVNPSTQLQTGPAPSASDLSGSRKPHPVPSGSSFKTTRDRKRRDADSTFLTRNSGCF